MKIFQDVYWKLGVVNIDVKSNWDDILSNFRKTMDMFPQKINWKFNNPMERKQMRDPLSMSDP